MKSSLKFDTIKPKIGSIWLKIEENRAGKSPKNRLFMGFSGSEKCNNFYKRLIANRLQSRKNRVLLPARWFDGKYASSGALIV